MGISLACDVIGEEIKSKRLHSVNCVYWTGSQNVVLEVIGPHLKLICDVLKERTIAWKRQLKLVRHHIAS